MIKEIPIYNEEFSAKQSIEFAEDPVGFMLKGMQTYGNLFYSMIGIKKTVIICHPALAQEILKNDQYYDIGASNKVFANLLGHNSIATAEGDMWKLHNKASRPAFALKEVNPFLETIEGEYARIFETWHAEQSFDLSENIKKAVAKSILTYMKHENPAHEELIVYIYDEFIEKLLLKSRNPYSREVRSSDEKRNFIVGSQKYRSLIHEIIEENRNGVVKSYQKNHVEPKYLQDQLASLLMLGYGSVVAALDTMMVLLSKHDAYRQRMRAEIKEHYKSIADLPKLKLLHNAINESLRVLPSAWMIFRKTLQDAVLAGEYFIPKDTEILLNFFAMNHNPTVWERDTEFLPERFETLPPEQVRAQFLPFGGGKRFCLGANLAFQEMCIFLAQFYKDYDLSLDNSELSVVPRLSLMYEPRQATVTKD